MSKVAADSSDEQASRACDLGEEIDKKLAQASAICNVTGLAREIHAVHRTIADAMWIASELIEEAQKAFKELRGIYHPKAVQQPS